jgi:uncharacterized repeat protein (TIGR01451 family)/LPXTG-motif cell wall-anchored protein
LWIVEKVLKGPNGVVDPDAPSSVTFPVTVTGADSTDFSNPILNPGDGLSRALLTDLRMQGEYTVSENLSGAVFGAAQSEDFLAPTIEIRLGNGAFVKTDKFQVTADAQGRPNQDVYIRVTNELKPITVKANKVWDDGSAQDRPDVYFQLVRRITGGEFTKVGASIIVPSSLEVTWSQLDKFDHNGNLYSYFARETNEDGDDYVPLGYVKIEEFDEETNTGTITNRMVPTTVEKTVTKTWSGDVGDDFDYSSRRPSEVKVTLYSGSSIYATVTLNDSNNWTHTWIGLPYGPVYSVIEDTVPYYTPEYDTELKITRTDNPFSPELNVKYLLSTRGSPNFFVSLKGSQYVIWTRGVLEANQRETFIKEFQSTVNGFRGMDIRNTTFLSGAEVASSELGVNIQEGEFWIHLDGWSSFNFGVYQDRLIVNNKYDPTSVTVTKQWEDFENAFESRPDQIQFTLYQGITTDHNDQTEVDTVFVSEPWTHTFTNLPKEDEGGNRFYYRVEEARVIGYQDPVYGIDNSGLTVRNTLDTTEVSVEKQWEDLDNFYELRPESIEVKLYQGYVDAPDDAPTLLDTQTISPEADTGIWQHVFNNLPKASPDGREYFYSVLETPVHGYEQPEYSREVVEGSPKITITNHLQTTVLLITKEWIDFGNREELRPEILTLHVYQSFTDNEGVTSKRLVQTTLASGLLDEDSWLHTVANLPVMNQDGYLYTYTVEEEWVEGYLPPIYSDVEEGHVSITNELRQASLEIDKEALTETFYREGDVIEYKVSISNTGNVTLTELSIEDSLSPLEGWTLKDERGEDVILPADLAAGESWTLTYRYIVTKADEEAIEGIVHNIVTVTTLDIPDPQNPEEPYKHTDEEEVPRSSFTVTKSAEPATFRQAGDIITYKVIVENTGQVVIEGLIIEDTVGAASIKVPLEEMTIAESITTNNKLDVGETWTLTYSYEVTKEDVENKMVLNVVSVQNPDDPEYPQEDEEDVPMKALTVEKTSQQASFSAVGQKISYTVVIKNIGEGGFDNLKIEDTLVPFEQMSLNESMNEDGVLEPGEVWTLSYFYTIQEADMEAKAVLNVVAVTDEDDPDNPYKDEKEVPKSGMTVVKTATEKVYHSLGDVLNYTVVITNTGKVDLTNVLIKDTLVPFSSMSLVESKASDKILEVGEVWTLTYKYTVTAKDVEAGSVHNVVTVTSPEHVDPERPDIPIEIKDEEEVPGKVEASLSVKKTVKEKSFKAAGDKLHYMIVITNTGQVDLGSIEILDTLKPLEDIQLIESIKEDRILEVGETWTMSYTYTVTKEDVSKGKIDNVVIVKSDKADDAMDKARVEKETSLPSTGSGSAGIFLFGGLVLVGLGAMVLRKRKKSQ